MSRHPEPRRPSRVVPTARPGGGQRLLVILVDADAGAYGRAVARHTRQIERALGSGVVANRAVGRGSFPTVRLEAWRPAWERWCRSIQTRDGTPLLRMDVASFYGSVGERALRHALGHGADGVLDVLRGLWDDGVTGLPIGPQPSAILANAVLAPVDAALREAGVVAMRWVDDWVVPVASTRVAGRALAAAERELRALGLQLNLAKTSVSDPGSTREIRRHLGSGVPGSGRAMMPAP
jgi:hypothetical protein